MKSEIHELINEAKDKLKALRMKDDWRGNSIL
jgi:hypothetical protein